MYEISGKNSITKKKRTVSIKIQMIVFFSEIKCIKYPATREAFIDAMISARKIPSDVLTSKYEATTVTMVKTAQAPKTIRYTLM